MKLKHLLSLTGSVGLLLTGTTAIGWGQTSLTTFYDCSGNTSCTDNSNTGVNSNDPVSLSYDNVISGFHSSAAYSNGGIYVWGYRAAANGTASLLTPTIISSQDFSGLDGTPVKIALGSSGTANPPTQFVILTDKGSFYAWGTAGAVLSNNLKSNTAFAKVSNLSLPSGVSYQDVKMMFGTYQTLAITTCNGDVYVLSQNSNIRQGGNNSTNSWVRIKKSSSNNDYLTNIVATRGNPNCMFALDANGNLWTWGKATRTGNSGTTTNQYATLVSKPNHSGTIKMIGVAPNRTTDNTYYVLYQDGYLYAMGNNQYGQLGNWNTSASNTWVQPKYGSGNNSDLMTDIAWISVQEHDNFSPFINAITKPGSTHGNESLYNWGAESGSDLGRAGSGTGTTVGGRQVTNPGSPASWGEGKANQNNLFVESGGHTTVVLQKCSNTFGYVGHRINGSMGDNSSASATDGTVHFLTAQLILCGIETSDADIHAEASAGQDGNYCKGTPIQLTGTPTGGTYSIAQFDGSPTNTAPSGITLSPTGALDASSYQFNQTSDIHTIFIQYTPPAGNGTCSDPVSIQISLKNCTSYYLSLKGQVWIDPSNKAILDNGETGLPNSGMFAYLTKEDGTILAKASLNPNTGKYNIQLSTDDIATITASYSGDFLIIVSPSDQPQQSKITLGQAPQGYAFTGTNDGTPHTDSLNGIIKISGASIKTYAGQAGNVSLPTSYNFGVETHNLPITLSAFDTRKNPDQKSALLTWTTSMELNSKYFDIQRSSDGAKWNSIGTVSSKAANGNSDFQLNYQFTDYDPVSGNNFYRLRMVDLDGTAAYSAVKMVNFDGISEVSIRPNPASTTLVVSGLQQNETLTVLDLAGRVLMTQKVNSTETKLNISALSSGMYYLSVDQTNGKQTTYKFIKN